MVGTRPLALRPCARARTNARLPRFARIARLTGGASGTHAADAGTRGALCRIGTLAALFLCGLAQRLRLRGRHAVHPALEALQPEFRQTFGHWSWLAKKGLMST